MAVFDDLIAMANPTVAVWDQHRQQGASWEIRLYVDVEGTPVDWTGCTASCQIRGRDGTLIYTWSSLTLTTGLLTMTATPTATSSLPAGLYVYDVDVVNGSGRRLPLLAGAFKIETQVTA